MTDRYTHTVGVTVIALVALASLAAVIWQIVHGHEVDPLLAGIATGAIGVLSPSPLRQTVTVDQPPGQPVPVEDAGLTVIEAVLIVLLLLVVLAIAGVINL